MMKFFVMKFGSLKKQQRAYRMRSDMLLFRLHIVVSTQWVDRYLVIHTAVRKRAKRRFSRLMWSLKTLNLPAGHQTAGWSERTSHHPGGLACDQMLFGR